VPEPPKRPGRTAFERDRARVLHSAALRRLAAKTQVVVPGESDFPRTRLTHSLECAQVGRELGKALGADPDLVEAACLAHDLGHPPFGHTGEEALDVVAEPCGGFEGNAQSLRILTRLEAKTFRADGRSAGLNLTRATLDAATKYPWARQEGRRKYGVYTDDAEVFGWLRAGAPAERRCLEAQIMDWADDIAYSVHDVEDGVHAEFVPLDRLTGADAQAAVVEVCRAQYVDAAPDELGAALDRLLRLPYWPQAYDGSLRALAALKNMTSELIGRFCAAAENATRERYGPGPLCRYTADLLVPRETWLECAMLKAVAARYVMQREGAPERYARQRELVRELAAALLHGAPETLDMAYAAAFRTAGGDSDRLRVVVDQVASMTDAAAIERHRLLLRRTPRDHATRA